MRHCQPITVRSASQVNPQVTAAKDQLIDLVVEALPLIAVLLSVKNPQTDSNDRA